MTFNPSAPSGTIPLNQVYLSIQSNFNQLNQQFQSDHIPFASLSGNPSNGYHTAVHLVPQSTPTDSSGFGQVYDNTVNDGISTDEILFFLTGGNLDLQMTRNFLPVIGEGGHTFLSGGIILQWGLFSGVLGSGVSGNVIFPQPFPNDCFGVWMNLQYDKLPPGTIPGFGDPEASISYDQNTLSGTSFDWFMCTGSTAFGYTQFFWVALGT